MIFGMITHDFALFVLRRITTIVIYHAIIYTV